MTRQIQVGGVPLGGGAPVSVQSMTNTKTEDVAATVAQIRALEAAGCDIVRVAVPNQAAARAIAAIKEQVHCPLVADIHFDYRLALEAAAAGTDKIRINPGNIGGPDHVKAVADACRARNIPIRIGVNGGSLEKEILAKYGGPTPEAMLESALGHVALLNRWDFDDICLSVKSSNVRLMIQAYQLLAAATDYPLHLGVTEAGTSYHGIIRSSIGIGALLQQGIGDTIRVSLTADPVEEVRAGLAILQALDLRKNGPVVISCPSCGRCNIDLIAIAQEVEQRLQSVQQDIVVAVMGCVVNGPGEARTADYGLAGGDGMGVIFQKGEIVQSGVPMDRLADALMDRILGDTEEKRER